MFQCAWIYCNLIPLRAGARLWIAIDNLIRNINQGVLEDMDLFGIVTKGPSFEGFCRR